ncbi:MAG: right-handed parallel beta-helix repeat-containing protein [Rikenellaceae bacterium]|nr:right-handed parallel beta-helix repeat-containing protein [Rikenellaceae bacterium]
MKKFLKVMGVAVIAALWMGTGNSYAAPAGGFYNVKDYGAVGDGSNIDSDAVNKAIEEASSAGGGTVYFPAGIYSCYSIRLDNNIRLYLDMGAVIKAAIATGQRGYDLPDENPHNEYQDFGHSHWKNSLIWGIGLHDIAIEGYGTIDGTEGLARGERRIPGINGANKAIALKECRGVAIRDISMLMCGHFALLATGVDNMILDNLTVDTNRDGFDIDCYSNVSVLNCRVNTLNDDAIVLKSSYGLGYAKATENVTITNCIVSGYDPGTMIDGTFGRTVERAPDRDGPTGRIKFGTESNGGFKNITITNCVFDRCRGLAIETVDGGIIEDIVVNNLAMRDISNSPIYIYVMATARAVRRNQLLSLR